MTRSRSCRRPSPSSSPSRSPRRASPGPPKADDAWRLDRWTHLARYELRAREQRLTPDFAGCAKCDGTCGARTFRVPPVGVSGWPGCPEALIRSPLWREGVRLWQLSKVSPLTGWPTAYAAPIVAIVEALESEAQTYLVEQFAPKDGGVPSAAEQQRRAWRPDRGRY